MTNVSEKALWLPVVGHEGKYEVSAQGNVRKIVGGKEYFYLKQFSSRGYTSCTLPFDTENGVKWKNQLIHRLVAAAFIPNPENKPHVNHKDSNPKNNNVNNLEWVTHKENMQHGLLARTLFKGVDVKKRHLGAPVVQLKMSGEFVQEYKSCTSAERTTKIQSVWDACSGLIYQSGGYRWMWKHIYEICIKHENTTYHLADLRNNWKIQKCFLIMSNKGKLIHISTSKNKIGAIDEYIKKTNASSLPKNYLVIEAEINPTTLF